MYPAKPTAAHLIVTASCVLAGCATTHIAAISRLPWLIPGDDCKKWYPPTSRRIQEEGRVLVEFHVDEKLNTSDVKVGQSELWNPKLSTFVDDTNKGTRLQESALRVVMQLNATASLDPNDHSKIDKNTLYRLTVIQCLDPGGVCAKLSPFPDTQSLPIVCAQNIYIERSIPVYETLGLDPTVVQKHQPHRTKRPVTPPAK
ncbi:MAG TPA: hypothetical protein VGV09_01470 [Steroidobacteraceae bacterium]|nr:hypothetical protein [Steroidobacteraceae bacterium]